MTKLFIKNMVCGGCILAVTNEMEKLGLRPMSVNLDEVVLPSDPGKAELMQLTLALESLGFEILDDPNQQIIENIKKLLIAQVQSQEVEAHFSISQLLSKELNKDYSTISKLFSQVEGITIEQFFILQRIEKVKELLFYNQLTLSEIAWKLGCSSV